MQANKVIIITAPSGAGKTSITRFLLRKYPSLAFSVSAATRQPRGSEQHGVDYYFISLADFQKHIQQHDFVEWEMVYEGKYYGTLKNEMERIWSKGKNTTAGYRCSGRYSCTANSFPDTSLSLFIQPPSIDVLRQRLLKRGTETEESISTRLGKAAYELSFTHAFNKVIVNDDFDNACRETENAILEFLGDLMKHG